MSESGSEGAVIRESLDIAGIQRDLDELEHDVRLGDLSDSKLSERVTALLSRLRESAGEEPSESESSIPRNAFGWHAARVKDDATGSETVSCWKEGDRADSEVVMDARWDHGTLILLYASVSGRTVAEGVNEGRRFELQSSDASAEVTPDPKAVADFHKRVRREMERFESAYAAPRWICGRCGWTNEEADATCSACLTPRGIGESGSSHAPATSGSSDWTRVLNPASERDGPPPGMSPDSKSTGEIQLTEEASRLLDDLSRRVGGAVIGAVTRKVRKQRKCINCGHAIGKKVRFCPECGTEQPAAKEADEGQK